MRRNPCISSCRWSLAVSVLGLLGAGCIFQSADVPPCPDVKKGDRWSIEILESSPGSGTTHEVPETAECLRDWGLDVGSVLEGDIAFLAGDLVCKAGILDITRVGDWEWSLRRDGQMDGSGQVLDGNYDIRLGSCVGKARVYLFADAGLPCDPALGQRCDLRFSVYGQTDPGVCDNQYYCAAALQVRVVPVAP